MISTPPGARPKPLPWTRPNREQAERRRAQEGRLRAALYRGAGRARHEDRRGGIAQGGGPLACARARGARVPAKEHEGGSLALQPVDPGGPRWGHCIGREEGGPCKVAHIAPPQEGDGAPCRVHDRPGAGVHRGVRAHRGRPREARPFHEVARRPAGAVRARAA